ncbi:MAG: homocysteine S-methyltransferase family protein [Oscillospiraceae bacterium]|nr:homocysteine S-methyltransferase family protein [Oscillospiraceae bacterium]
MAFRDMLEDKILLYDGSKGFLLMQKGLAPGECPDMWNLDRADAVLDIHMAYVGAGADVIQTNTLQASRPHLEARGLYGKLSDINRAGVALAKKAAGQRALTAASIGPLGALMAPLGEMGHEEAHAAFAEQIAVVLDAGADMLHFETFTDLSELRIALLAAKGIDRSVPVIATISIEKSGRTVMGDGADCAAAALAAAGADCVGANCGLAPSDMLGRFAPFAAFGAPLCSKPNAGAPEVVGGVLSYGATEAEFYDTAFGFAKLGARLVGGCCGSGPSHVRRLREAVDAMNADGAYAYASIFKNSRDGAGAGQGDAVELYSHSAGAVLSREAIASFAQSAPLAAGGAADAAYAESGDGKLLMVDLSHMRFENGNAADKVVEILSDAGESDAEATLFRLLTGGRRTEDALRLLGLIAEYACAYHNKPLIFHTDDARALGLALERYCGAPAVLAPKAGEDALRPAFGLVRPRIIYI